MSIINEALKKAQRLRTEEALEAAAPLPAGGVRIAKHGKAHSANTMVLLGTGGIVLVVLSVVFTVYWVNRPGEPLTRSTTAALISASAKPPSASETAAATTPPIVAPAITAPIATSASETIVATPPSVSPATTAPSTVASAATNLVPSSTPASTAVTPAPAAIPAAVTPEVTPAPAAPHPTTPDERIAAFVEAIRVTGIRSSGSESRVLMNERVYRVNDIVERTLNVRLIKVAADSLTFSDSRGVTYVKYF